MKQWMKQVAVAAWLWAIPLFLTSNANAASLGRIEVNSRLGEPFYAEVPLELDADEVASRVLVEIADGGDYRIFEVYRDPVLDAIRADIVSDKRGTRVELSSRTSINSPFFNLVLKIRTGRVSHFRKYPVMIDTAKTAEVAARAPQADAVQPADNQPINPVTTTTGQVAAVETKEAAPQPGPWARTDTYGPIVRGDSLSVIASRLRTDDRYSVNQAMVALFEKNRDKFDKENMNLLMAGSVLKVPTAAEVESHSAAEARKILREHEKAWKELVEQPRYAVAAEEQRTRYTKRISVGEQATGGTAAPALTPEAESRTEPVYQPVTATSAETDAAVASAEQPSADTTEKPDTAAIDAARERALLDAAREQTDQILGKIEQKNDQLQEQLDKNNQNMEALSNKIDSLAVEASKARIDKLEILIARLQSQLEKERQPVVQQNASGLGDWVAWLLATIVLALLAVVVVLLRREPAHPATVAGLAEQAVETEKEAPVAQEAGDLLAAAIEEEVAAIERDDSKPNAVDSLVDALTDTDTTELDSFDESAQEPDPNVDYLSEAAVYIRYGMADEALQQLDMALRLNPANVDAHIKKAEILLGNDDRKGFEAAVALANRSLAAAQVVQFRQAVAGLGTDTGVKSPVQVVADDLPALDDVATDTLLLDEADVDDLPIEFEVDDDAAAVESQPQVAAASGDEGGMDWLFDESFDNAGEGAVDATLHLNDLLGEFPVEQAVAAEPAAAAAAPVAAPVSYESEEESALDYQVSATLELDNLLQAFADEADEEESVDAHAQEEIAPVVADRLEVDAPSFEAPSFEFPSFDAPVASQPQAAASSFVAERSVKSAEEIADEEMGATMRLDQLLGEFDFGDDELINFDEEAELDSSTFSVADVDYAFDDSAAEFDHGATQELDSLLSEFIKAEVEPEAAPVQPSFAAPASPVVKEPEAAGQKELIDAAAEEFHAPVDELDWLSDGAADVEESTFSELTSADEVAEVSASEDDLALTGADDAADEFDLLQRDLAAGKSDETDLSFALEDVSDLDEFDMLQSSSVHKDDQKDATEELGSLLSGFAEDDQKDATEELGSLLSGFAEDDQKDATEELGSLLSGFAEDDQKDATEELGSLLSGFAEDDQKDATEELGSLLSGFAEDDQKDATEELGSLLSGFAEDDQKDATEELGSLLSGFAEDDQKDATEELGSLLSGFAEDDQKDATEELGSLLSGFAEEEKPDSDTAAELDALISKFNEGDEDDFLNYYAEQGSMDGLDHLDFDQPSSAADKGKKKS
ncbi:hypothetical protein FE236_12650 [Mariprofundus erugo]|uniref:FimV N-terminal domain-containing protein n=1 Tax=Mariprofundus erugo TaxID=2528639 RepID=A0A5R9GPY0_9PROT|nr:FimV/HubP family polar landmark protein [Mariprofundus erugo]TLS67648.1 hypothetical protein FEF65_06965 [Mariprofundus erugo]TLS73855.1 hypothetical protein FE236_12650 [Mariprofundus erugo]